MDVSKTTAAPSATADADKEHHLITLVTNRRVKAFASRELARIATEVILFQERRCALRLDGFIVMPDHIHIICEPLADLDLVVRNIRELISSMTLSHLAVADRNMLRSIESPGQREEGPVFRLWRRGYHHVRIPTKEKLFESLRYMYEHPVRSGICAAAIEYEFSDMHRHLGSILRTGEDRPCLVPARKGRGRPLPSRGRGLGRRHPSV